MRNGVFVLGGQSVSNHVLVEWARAYPLRSCPRGHRAAGAYLRWGVAAESASVPAECVHELCAWCVLGGCGVVHRRGPWRQWASREVRRGRGRGAFLNGGEDHSRSFGDPTNVRALI